jgi:hypothetical protein
LLFPRPAPSPIPTTPQPPYPRLIAHHIAKAQQYSCKAKVGPEIVHLLSKSCVLLAESYLHTENLVLFLEDSNTFRDS